MSRKVWIVTPHERPKDYDCWVGPAEDEADAARALLYAQNRLEGAWDEMVAEDEVTVTIRLDEMDEDDFNATQDPTDAR